MAGNIETFKALTLFFTENGPFFSSFPGLCRSSMEILLKLPPTGCYWRLCRLTTESPLEALALFYLQIAPALEGYIFVCYIEDLPSDQ